MIKIPYPLVGVSGEEGEGEKKLVEKEEFVHMQEKTGFRWQNKRSSCT